MTHRHDVARGHDIIERWCVLAEQRLDHLTELFETGRWRRYHSERAFLENIQEAKTAVETWRGLLTRQANRDNSAIDMSWLGHTQASLLRGDGLRDRADRPQPKPAQVQVDPAREVSMPVESALVASDEAPSAPDLDTPVLTSPILDARMLETAVAAALHVGPLQAPVLDGPAMDSAEPDSPDLDAADPQEPTLDIAAALMLDIDTIEQRYPLLRNAL